MEFFKALAGRKSEGVSKFLIDLQVIKKQFPLSARNIRDKKDFKKYLKEEKKANFNQKKSYWL